MHKQHEIYMANTKILCCGPNATYIPLARIGGNTNVTVCVGGNAKSSVFRYQHVGIANAKFWPEGTKPT